MKKCRNCEKEKNREEFYKKSSRSDGLYSYCKECTSSKSKLSHEINKEARKESQKRYREKNRENLSNKSSNYYYENREICLKTRSEYRKNNKEKISILGALRRRSDPERFEKNREKYFQWSIFRREKLNAYQREWYRKNKEKRRAHVQLSRAIKSGKIMRPRNCSECYKECVPDGHHSDYSKPLDVIWVCRACHSRKSPRTIII